MPGRFAGRGRLSYKEEQLSSILSPGTISGSSVNGAGNQPFKLEISVRVRVAPPGFPSSNGQDYSVLTSQCRFESGRESPDVGASSNGKASGFYPEDGSSSLPAPSITPPKNTETSTSTSHVVREKSAQPHQSTWSRHHSAQCGDCRLRSRSPRFSIRDIQTPTPSAPMGEEQPGSLEFSISRNRRPHLPFSRRLPRRQRGSRVAPESAFWMERRRLRTRTAQM